MIYYLNSVGGSNSNFKPLFENGEWSLDDFTINPSVQAPFGYVIDGGYIVSLSTYDSKRDSGFVILPKDSLRKYGFVFVLADNGTGAAQYGRCQRDADAYICQQTGTGRISYQNVNSFSGTNLFAETSDVVEGEFIAFGKGILIMGIYYYPLE